MTPQKIEKLWHEIVHGGRNIQQLEPLEIAAIEQTVAALDRGEFRLVKKISGATTADQAPQYQTEQWLKQAILLYFRLKKMTPIEAGEIQFLDKVPLKEWTTEMGVRVVPPAVARYGSYIESGVILMPSFVNIGAFVGSGTMVDTWATVGSCAQIGRNVHLSGGVGIGGVLEPLQASPVIVEDNCFIGSRCIVVEGALIEEGAVLGAGVTITSSTKIIDVTGSEAKTYTGRVPPRSVVIPGSLTKKFPAGEYGVNCALIIGQRSANTDLKTSLNNALRDYQVSV